MLVSGGTPASFDLTEDDDGTEDFCGHALGTDKDNLVPTNSG
jgi:hypothetical protein